MIQITSRERRLAIGLTAVIGVWGLYTLAIRPARERVRTLQRVLPEKQAQLQDLLAKCAEYTALQNDLGQLQAKMAAQEADFQFLPFLETMIARHRLDRHVVAMQRDIMELQPGYSEVVVTVELQDISLKQLVDFLSAVEASRAVTRVGSLHIRKDPTNEALIDSTVAICSPEPRAAPAQLAQN